MMEILGPLADNWEMITAGAVAMVAGADQLFIILIATLKNISDAWYAAFPKKEDPKVK